MQCSTHRWEENECIGQSHYISPALGCRARWMWFKDWLRFVCCPLREQVASCLPSSAPNTCMLCGFVVLWVCYFFVALLFCRFVALALWLCRSVFCGFVSLWVCCFVGLLFCFVDLLFCDFIDVVGFLLLCGFVGCFVLFGFVSLWLWLYWFVTVTFVVLWVCCFVGLWICCFVTLLTLWLCCFVTLLFCDLFNYFVVLYLYWFVALCLDVLIVLWIWLYHFVSYFVSFVNYTWYIYCFVFHPLSLKVPPPPNHPFILTIIISIKFS